MTLGNHPNMSEIGWFSPNNQRMIHLEWRKMSHQGGKFLALKQSDYYFHIFSRARIKLMVSALARCRVGSARPCSVRDCGDWPAEKERVFSVWSLAWEQSESGHHTTLWQPRGRQWRQHTPPGPAQPPIPALSTRTSSHIHTQTRHMHVNTDTHTAAAL